MPTAFNMVLLLYKALGKVANLRESAFTLLLLAAVEVVCFVVEPLRFIFGGTFLFLVTLALGQTVKFTGWHDLAQWLQRLEQAGQQGSAEADANPDPPTQDGLGRRARGKKKSSVRVRLFLRKKWKQPCYLDLVDLPLVADLESSSNLAQNGH